VYHKEGKRAVKIAGEEGERTVKIAVLLQGEEGKVKQKESER
jgi:hypothetical protein